MTIPTGTQVNSNEFDFGKIKRYLMTGVPVLVMLISHWTNSGNITRLENRIIALENGAPLTISNIEGIASDVKAIFSHPKPPRHGSTGHAHPAAPAGANGPKG